MRVTVRSIAGGVVRAVLVGIGVVTALAMWFDWTQTSPLGASAGSWFRWIVEEETPALLAVAVGLFPRSLGETIRRWGPRAGRALFRGSVGLVGLALLAWYPSGVVAAGVHGFTNQLLGILGAPARWGALPITTSTGGDGLVQGVLSYALLGLFCLTLALRPDLVLRALLGEQTPAPGEGLAGDRRTTAHERSSTVVAFDAGSPVPTDVPAVLVAPAGDAER